MNLGKEFTGAEKSCFCFDEAPQNAKGNADKNDFLRKWWFLVSAPGHFGATWLSSFSKAPVITCYWLDSMMVHLLIDSTPPELQNQGAAM